MAVINPGVTSVTATAPVTSSGGTAPNIALTTSGANSVVLRDANQNISVNSISEGYVNVAAAGTTTVLTAASAPNYVVTGSGGQTYQLPNATTLPNGVNFTFNNNQSSGAITVNNNSGTLIVSVPSGAFVDVSLLSNAIAAGSWDRHDFTPANVSWSTNTLDYAGSITSATWNGNVVAINRGGTGASSLAAASIATYAGTETLSNKRIDPRVTTAATATTLTPSIATADVYAYTALATGLTINAPTGTPLDGDKLIFRLLDNGTARALTWDATYTVIGTTLPTTTVINKTTYVGCMYNANNTRWDVIAVTTQA